MEPQAGVSNEVELNPPQQDRVISNMEEEMVMEVGAADVRRTFPSEEEDDMECEESSQNNNATVTVENERDRVQIGAAGSRTLPLAIEQTRRPELICLNPASNSVRNEGVDIIVVNNELTKTEKTFLMMQEFMLKKGLIKPGMSDKELQEFLTDGEEPLLPTQDTQNLSNRGTNGKTGRPNKTKGDRE